MSVIQTEKWLEKYYTNPITLCEQLEKYFNQVPAKEIHQYLSFYGMYRRPNIPKKTMINSMNALDIWNVVREEEKHLRKEWNAPQIPIFIFPSDQTNRKLMRDSGGKSGVAFKDKLFLFVSDKSSLDEIRALFTHEYNHVARLYHYRKQEKEQILLDSMILEGLAENAVRERLGEQHLASWTTYYSTNQLESIWKKLLYPARNHKKSNPKHDTLLIGLKLYPKMIGYAVGYHLVKKYIEKHDISIKNLLQLSSEKIAMI